MPRANKPDRKLGLETKIESVIARSTKSAIAKKIAKKVFVTFPEKCGNTGSIAKAAPTELNPKQRIAESIMSTKLNAMP